MGNDSVRPGGPSSFGSSPQAVSPLRASVPDARPWALCGYAPGGYLGKCHSCGGEFQGDKRALECLDCAATSANHLLAHAKDSLRELAETNERLMPVLTAAEILLEVHDALGAGQSAAATMLRAAIAQAIETRSAETEGLRPKDESAVPEECALPQPTSPSKEPL